jgi:hypothetical protein
MNTIAMNRLRAHHGLRPVGLGAPPVFAGWTLLAAYNGSDPSAVLALQNQYPEVGVEISAIFAAHQSWPSPGLSVPLEGRTFRFVTIPSPYTVYVYVQNAAPAPLVLPSSPSAIMYQNPSAASPALMPPASPLSSTPTPPASPLPNQQQQAPQPPSGGGPVNIPIPHPPSTTTVVNQPPPVAAAPASTPSSGTAVAAGIVGAGVVGIGLLVLLEAI